MKVACPHCTQRIELDESWFGKLLNCPNCRGVIDVPSKSTYEALGAQAMKQLKNARSGRILYLTLAGVLLMLAPLPVLWHLSRSGEGADSPSMTNYMEEIRSEKRLSAKPTPMPPEQEVLPEITSASTKSATAQAPEPPQTKGPNVFKRIFNKQPEEVSRSADDEPAPDPIQKLLASPELWPREVTLAQDTEFPAVLNGNLVGKVKVNAGAKVGLRAVEADAVEVEFRGGKAKLPHNATDLAQLAAAVGATDTSRGFGSKEPNVAVVGQSQGKEITANQQTIEVLQGPEQSNSRMSGNANESTDVSLNQPKGLAFDSKNNLYVADSDNHRILAFSPDLKLLRSLAEEGSDKGQFNRPFDVAIDSKGRWVVADTGNHRIQIFDAKGNFVKAFGSNGAEDGQFDHPSNVTIDDQDNIIVTDRNNNRLQVFDCEGKSLFTFSNRTGEKTVERIEAEKSWALQEDPTKNPDEIKVDPIWKISDYGQLNEPGGTWYDKINQELWVANGWNCRYERFDYDSRNGEIRRKSNELIDGIVRGPWYTRGCTGTIDGGLIGLQTHFGALQVFSDRSELTSSSPISREFSGKSLGEMGGIHDIASNSTGELAVADPGNNRIVFFDKDLTVPPNPCVTFIARDGAQITWKTSTTSPTEILLRRGDLPERTKGREAPWSDGQDEISVVRFSSRHVLVHEAVLTGLKPGTRYYYKVRQPESKVMPSGGWSREYAFVTHAAEGEVEFLRFPLKTLLIPNLIDVETVRPDTPYPEPMSEPDIQRYYRNQWKQVELFYWVNSRMKYLIDHDIYVDETMYRTGDIRKGQFKDDDQRAKYEVLPVMNHGTGEAIVAQNQTLEEAVTNNGRDDELHFGQMVVECIRDWNEREQAWKYRGSGGGAFGLEDWPTPGRTFFLGGGDVAWLLCHEYKHQVESNYNVSGLDKPQDRMWFCHFSQPFPGWDLSSAEDHGDHWDGIAWQLRHHKRDSYLRSLFGHVEVAIDKDGDGIPDDDPRVPLDEKRLGSSPESQDTDNDGLLDMDEVLASTWVRAMLSHVRSRVEADYIRPDLTKADSDSDGIPDGLDKYPIYPYAAEIPKGTATIDGKLDEWTGAPQIKFNADGITIEVWSRWSNSINDPRQEFDETDALFYAVRMTGNWSNLNVVFDFDADGFYVGNDNLHVDIARDSKKGPVLRSVKMHMCKLGRWPWFDNKHQFFKPDEIRFASAVSGDEEVVEFAIPKRDILGLHLKRSEEIGLTLNVGLPDGGQISVFEPYDIFDSTLVE